MIFLNKWSLNKLIYVTFSEVLMQRFRESFSYVSGKVGGYNSKAMEVLGKIYLLEKIKCFFNFFKLYVTLKSYRHILFSDIYFGSRGVYFLFIIKLTKKPSKNKFFLRLTKCLNFCKYQSILWKLTPWK